MNKSQNQRTPPRYSVIDSTFTKPFEIFFNRDPGEYEPGDHRPAETATSSFGAGINLLKASLGAGILAMPLAFKNIGLIGGLLGTLIVGIICTHGVYILVKTSQMICREARLPFLGYADTCDFTFRYGPTHLQKFAPLAREFADWSLAVTHLGACCVYVVVIAVSFKQVVDFYEGPNLDVRIWCALTLVCLIPLTQIQKLKYLIPFSASANFVWLISIGITIGYCFATPPALSERSAFGTFGGIPLFVSVCLFAMEGIGIVMPVENDMRKPNQFLGCPGVLNISMGIVIFLYAFVGFMGYWKFGDDTRGTLTLNLPQDRILAQVTKILVALVLMLSFALIYYVPVDVVWRKLERRIAPKSHFYCLALVRLIGTLLTVGIAVAIPKLDLFIELVGAICLSIMGLLMPAILQSVHYWSRHHLRHRKLIFFKNALLVLFSLLALFSGSSFAIKNIMTNL